MRLNINIKIAIELHHTQKNEFLLIYLGLKYLK
jgi:hypothetical protein